ncbi:hypothetical protein AB0C52_24035 [Streptomyces sp. NPDC048717]|uniref:hypothetical protein n=1 Tax=Streptomyces sp. NPDC048717 TaxID=3154928 RepID=UPI003430DA3C
MLTEADLSTWERPDAARLPVAYWAHPEQWSRYEAGAYGSQFVLPNGEPSVPLVLVDGMTVWVDSEEGWLWAALPKEPERWASGSVPDWVLTMPTKSFTSRRLNKTVRRPALVRRRLAEGEAVAVLDQIMPPASSYELPAAWAQVLRLGGWMPGDIIVGHSYGPPRGERRVWWRVDDLADVQALARKLPMQWKRERWPLDRMPGDATFGPAARQLAGLLDQGIPPETVATHRALGRSLDLDELKLSVDPVIPDDATRVRLTSYNGCPYFSLTARSARDQLARRNASTPGRVREAAEVLVDTTPGLVPLHVDPERHFVVWSDGALDYPAEVYQPEKTHIGGAWPRELQRLLAARDLVVSCTRATNWPDLRATRVWEAWLDAASVESTVAEQSATAAHKSERTVTLTRHSVTSASGTVTDVWEVRTSLIAMRGINPRREHTMFTDEGEARAAFAAADDGLPPVMTVGELAEHLGAAADELRRALYRTRERTNGPGTIDMIGGAKSEPGWVGTYSVDPSGEGGHLYDPRTVQAWWAAS